MDIVRPWQKGSFRPQRCCQMLIYWSYAKPSNHDAITTSEWQALCVQRLFRASRAFYFIALAAILNR